MLTTKRPVFLRLTVLGCCLVCVQSLTPVLISHFTVPNPAFLSLYPHSDGNGSDLLITSFAFGGMDPDALLYVEHVEKYLRNSSATAVPVVLTSNTSRPSDPSGIPENIFNKRLIALPDGFFAPPKTSGGISLVDPSLAGGENKIVITNKGEKWFYQRVEWRDMDQDGDLDVLSSRSEVRSGGPPTKGELVWFENAGSLDQPTPWESHVIGQGPDIPFNEVRLRVSGGSEGRSLSAIFAGQFFTPDLGVFWVENSGNWSETEQIRYRGLETAGPVQSLEVVDVNDDGRLDLLVTVSSFTNGTLWAYEIPDDFRTGIYRRHLLASGFKSTAGLRGGGAPGKAFVINQDYESAPRSKPWIVLSGAEEGTAYLLSPQSRGEGDWRYTTTPMLDMAPGLVGKPALGDVDGDGRLEMFLSAFNRDTVFVYRLQ